MTTKVAFIDTETTGLQAHDEPISVGVLLYLVERKSGRPIEELGRYHGFRQPRVPIHPKAQQVHGISAQTLEGKEFDHEKVRHLISDAEILVAHHAAFDCRMMARFYPEIRDKPWRCSYRQFPWPKIGNRKLDTVCDHLNISRPTPHTAETDCRALADALFLHSGKTSRSRTYLGLLLNRSPYPVLEQSNATGALAITVAASMDGIVVTGSLSPRSPAVSPDTPQSRKENSIGQVAVELPPFKKRTRYTWRHLFLFGLLVLLFISTLAANF